MGMANWSGRATLFTQLIVGSFPVAAVYCRKWIWCGWPETSWRHSERSLSHWLLCFPYSWNEKSRSRRWCWLNWLHPVGLHWPGFCRNRGNENATEWFMSIKTTKGRERWKGYVKRRFTGIGISSPTMAKIFETSERYYGDVRLCDQSLTITT